MLGHRPVQRQLLVGRDLVTDVRNGITTPQGMRMLRLSLRRMVPGTVVVSLGSNDGGDPRRFADRLQRNAVSLNKDEVILPGREVRLMVRAVL